MPILDLRTLEAAETFLPLLGWNLSLLVPDQPFPKGQFNPCMPLL